MDYELAFGRRRRARKSRSPVRKTSKKVSKKMLDSLTLKKLKVLAKKYKVSCYKKGTKVCVKKSTLLKRLKKSRSINKILKSASMMKKSKSSKRSRSPKRERKASPKRARRASPKRRHSRFGMSSVAANTPHFSTPLELSLGQTYEGQKRHYKSIPTSLISQNFQGTGAGSFKNRMQLHSKNFPYTQGSLGRSSLPPYENINSKDHPNFELNRFGRYFR